MSDVSHGGKRFVTMSLSDVPDKRGSRGKLIAPQHGAPVPVSHLQNCNDSQFFAEIVDAFHICYSWSWAQADASATFLHSQLHGAGAKEIIE